MAENQLVPRERARDQQRAVEADWSTLVARAVDDISRILQSEIRLLSASLKTVLEEQIERVLAFMATGALLAGGAICMLAALILFLHEYVMLPWWQSFGIVGLGFFALAIAVGAFATRRTKIPATT
jgi:hypothetical protein